MEAHRPTQEAQTLKARLRARRMRRTGRYLVETIRPGRRAYHEVSAKRFAMLQELLMARGHVSGTWARARLDLFLWDTESKYGNG